MNIVTLHNMKYSCVFVALLFYLRYPRTELSSGTGRQNFQLSYDIAIDVLGKEHMQLRPEVMHRKLADGIMCKPCFSKVKKLTEALNVTKPIHKTMDVPGSRGLDRLYIYTMK